jgi:NTE family protein
MPGLTEIPLHDCVVASCAIPGIFPPKRISRFSFVDGSLVDTLPVKIAVYNRADLIIAVFLECIGSPMDQPLNGLASILGRSQSILSRTLMRLNLDHFNRAPIILIQPDVGAVGMFEFEKAGSLVDEGERAAREVLSQHPLFQDWIAQKI